MTDIERIELVRSEIYLCEPKATAALYELRDRLASLKKALDRYGTHHSSCEHEKVHGACTCGFDEALVLNNIVTP